MFAGTCRLTLCSLSLRRTDSRAIGYRSAIKEGGEAAPCQLGPDPSAGTPVPVPG
jgi:hypothetical protein